MGFSEEACGLALHGVELHLLNITILANAHALGAHRATVCKSDFEFTKSSRFPIRLQYSKQSGLERFVQESDTWAMVHTAGAEVMVEERIADARKIIEDANQIYLVDAANNGIKLFDDYTKQSFVYELERSIELGVRYADFSGHSDGAFDYKDTSGAGKPKAEDEEDVTAGRWLCVSFSEFSVALREHMGVSVEVSR